MKRIGRYTFNTLALLSLLLCVTAGAFWRRSHFVADLFHARTDGRWFYADFGEGRVLMGVWSRAEWNPQSLHPDHVRQTIAEHRSMMRVHASVMPAQPRVLGVEYRRAVPTRTTLTTLRELEFSCGHLVALTGAVPLIWISATALRPRRIRAAKAKGMCPTCGYDLRATPDRCPECGTVTPATARSPTNKTE